MSLPVIAIDGPAGTGKSTTAQRLAETLDWPYVDSGAFYRVAAWLALREGIEIEAETARSEIRAGLQSATIERLREETGWRTIVDDEDVTEAIRAADVTAVVSRVAADGALREVINEEIRRLVGEGPAVVDGRDIGTVVFPDAILKIFLVASLEERARRRAAEQEPRDRASDPDVLERYARSLADRDESDRARRSGPLKRSADAIELDTTSMTPGQQVERVLGLLPPEMLDRNGV